MKITELLTYLSNPALLVLILLGVFSITRLITTDSFPPIEKLRLWIFDRFPPDGYRTRRRPTSKKVRWVVQGDWYDVTVGHYIGELIHCPWCAGWWVSLAATIALVYLPLTTILVLTPFALRGAVGWISRLTS